MKAVLSQIPENERQTSSLNDQGRQHLGILWAQLRRLKAQVASLETAVSTCRRDINRIDKKQYRDNGNTPPSEIEKPVGEAATLPPGLFD